MPCKFRLSPSELGRTPEDAVLSDNYPPRQIFLAGRNVVCDSADDLTLLKDAQALEIDPASTLKLSIGRLQLMKDACQKYSLGKYQRIVNQAIDRFGL
jgi:hypothetical protein